MPKDLAVQPSNPLRSSANPLTWQLVALLSVYVLLLVLGIGIFHSPWAMPRGNEMGWDRATFASLNAATLTGFQPSVLPAQYQWTGQIATFGLIIAGILFNLIAGGILAVRVLRLRYRISHIVGSAITAMVLATFVGALFLAEPGNPMAGVFSGAAAFGNCGLTLAPLHSLASWQTQLVLLPLAVLGGLGLPVLMQSAGWVGGHNTLDRHTRTVFTWSAGLFLLGLILLLAMRYIDPAGQTAADSWRTALGASSAASVDMRTFGLPLPFTTLFPANSMRWIALLFMAVGASSAGTGGGIKTTTLAVLLAGLWRTYRRQQPGRLFAIAAIWLGIYCLVAFLCLLALLVTQPQLAPDRLLFMSISALSNVGLSKDPISLTGPALYILSITMLLGRLLPLAILWWTAKTVPDADLLVA
jgi:trk system potassium uptake protein TrkH